MLKGRGALSENDVREAMREVRIALLEADVLLPGGDIVTCTGDNEHADLFNALPN